MNRREAIILILGGMLSATGGFAMAEVWAADADAKRRLPARLHG